MSKQKARTIELGIGKDGPVLLDIDVLLRTRGFVSASSGGGKSHLLRRLIEQISPFVQCIVLDWEGEYATLRTKFPFVLVGEGGETPAHPATAAQVALTLLKLGASAVCDLYELKGNGRHEFVRNFVNAMVSAPKELWHPVIVIVDEAHYLCPENGYGESDAKDAIIDLCNLGRKRGFCPILASQRASKVSKNATEPLQNYLIGLTMPDDQKRICNAFKIAPGSPTREFSSALENLETGEFFVRGAAVSKTLQLIKVGGTVTQPPPTGSAAAARHTRTPESIKALLPQLEDIPVQAEKKAQTEAELRKEIADLKRQLRTQPAIPKSVTPPPKSVDTERIRMLTAQVQSLQKTAGVYEKAMTNIVRLADSLSETAGKIKEAVASAQGSAQAAQAEIPAATLPVPAQPRIAAPVVPRATTPASNGDGTVMPAGERKVLIALAQYPGGLERAQVGIFSGYEARSTRDAYIQRLQKRGYAVENGTSLQATSEGLAALGSYEPLPMGSELLNYWLGRLPLGERQVLQVVCDGVTSREEIGERSGYTARSTRDAYIQRLAKKLLIDVSGSSITANPNLQD